MPERPSGSGEFLQAISWLGADVTLSLFVVGSGEVVSRPPGVIRAGRVNSCCLEDPDRGLGDREVYEHDLSFDGMPGDVRALVERWLVAAIDGGAEVAWFGFEGSFSFEHLLTRDIASLVYGVADRTGVHTAMDDARRESSDWALRVEGCRERLWGMKKGAPGN